MTTALTQDSSLVLVVDRDRDTRTLFMEMVQFWGYRAAEARSATEALQIARSIAPALITTGIGFPDDRDGCWLCEQLRSSDTTRNIPIVVITAWVMGGHIDRARRAGADSVLTKPCSPSALHAELRRLARTRSLLAG